MDTLSEANGTFALKLLKTLAKSNSKNISFSPMSFSSALAMVSMGARGNTAAQMCQALSFSKVEGRDVNIHQGFQLLLAEINRTDTRYLLRTATRLFGEKSHDFFSHFTDCCGRFYQARMEQLDFVNAADESRKYINTWVADKMEGKIMEVLPSGSIDSTAKLVLVNAVYFKGNWDNQFDKEMTRQMLFRTSKTDKISVPMMCRKSFFEMTYVKEISTQVLVLPYVGKELNMIIMLPDENTDLNMVEEELSYEKFLEWTRPDKMRKKALPVFLPRFRLEENYNMKDVLQYLGMEDAFDEGRADLSGMSSEREMCLSTVIHKAVVAVTEEGTEEPDAMDSVLYAFPPHTPAFCADHPFLFFIQHNKNKSLLFCGRFSSP